MLGVSADGEASHKDFIADLGLNFSLLADTNKCVLKEGGGGGAHLLLSVGLCANEHASAQNGESCHPCCCRDTNNGLMLYACSLLFANVSISRAAFFAGP